MGAPFWVEGELPVFVVRPRAPNRDACTVTVRYEYMYRATPNIYIYISISICVLKLFIISDMKCTVKCTDVRLILDNKVFC